MRLVIATGNRHKLAEIRQMLTPRGLAVCGLDAYGPLPDVVEDGETFLANATKKAVEVSRALGEWALADDSGLEVHALDGQPGVRSARFAGEPPDSQANNRKLLDLLHAAGDRRARFRCVMVLASPCGQVADVEGTCDGRILTAPRGTAGFGYDPLFVPAGYDVTFAEMPPTLKNRISHRGRALRRAVVEWSELLSDLR